ncbi:MAG: DNA polymerase III subunit gamma and tau [Acidobacteria bacterium]|nr:DNA polymerase III subunit gamma and tau [Acidobacteriota bacterium]
MVTALYRRYRPETFAELIGQSQVTDPLRTALRTDRVNHAYLFSGPRGCGKTTSARILARCLNCAEGPTDTPCGKCASCIELARDGSGSLDVVEIDAASHNGVDDARDLRERAAFAPARDRYKIFILDEAHMVTPQGFNALLKLVEEPPDHVKFIFATTEPEKVIGTIRSRTHHYPFRLVPPAQMLEYVQQLCDSEKVSVQPGVLPLVVRAGGGSVRDTLSLLDQLISGSEVATGSTGSSVEYARAVALLGYTHAALLDEVVDALGAMDAGAAFSGVDRVIQTGQDPRRFVEDLLERLRDLIVVAATRDGAAAVLRGIPQDELDRMNVQAAAFGAAELSRAADVVNSSLTEMTGATSPRLHLELMIARLLVPAADDTERGALARVERLERRIGIADASIATETVAAPSGAVSSVSVSVPVPARERHPAATPTRRPVSPDMPVDPPAERTEPATSTEPANVPTSRPDAPGKPVVAEPTAAVTLAQLRDAWPEILEVVQKAKRTAWMVVYTSTPRVLESDVLTLSFPSETDVTNFKERPPSGDSVSEQLRTAISTVLGIRVKFKARVDISGASAPAAQEAHAAPVVPAPAAAAPTGGWNVIAIPGADDAPPADEPEPPFEPFDDGATTPEGSTPAAQAVGSAASAGPTQPRRGSPAPTARYGEAVVRELLGASFIEEQNLAPRDRPLTLETSPASSSTPPPASGTAE